MTGFRSATLVGEDPREEAYFLAIEVGVNADRSVTTAIEEAEKFSLGGDFFPCLRVIKSTRESSGSFIAIADFESDGSLPSGREKFVFRETVCEDVGKMFHSLLALWSGFRDKAKPYETGLGEKDRIVIVMLGEFHDARWDVSTEIQKREIEPEEFDLFSTPHTAGAYFCADFQSFDSALTFHKKHIPDRCSFKRRREAEPSIDDRRHVLQTMNRDIDRAVGEGFFEFFDKNTFVKRSLRLRHIRERDVCASVACGLDDFPAESRFRKFSAQQSFCGRGLHKREFATPCADDDFFSFAHFFRTLNAVGNAFTQE